MNPLWGLGSSFRGYLKSWKISRENRPLLALSIAPFDLMLLQIRKKLSNANAFQFTLSNRQAARRVDIS
jgi:hypothetical protein